MTAKSKAREISEKARAVLEARANVTLGDPLPKISGKRPALVKDETTPDLRAWEDAVEQVRRAKESLRRPASDYVQYPLAGIAGLVGGVPPCRVHTFVMGSNVGKTTLARSFIQSAIEMGQSVSVMTTEATPDDFRKGLAAAEVGIHPGDIATGEFLKWPNAEEIVARMDEALERWQSYEEGAHRKLIISASHGYLTPQKVRQNAQEAADLGVTWTVIDHWDHVEAANGISEPQMSNAVVSATWASAVDFDLRYVAFSQMNQEVFKQNPLGICVPPQESWVKYGGKKKEVSWVMFGGYRPLRSFTDEDERKKEKEAFRNGERTLAQMTEPNILRLRLMKHRDYGERVGGVCSLELRDGRLRDDHASSVHRIRTNRDVV